MKRQLGTTIGLLSLAMSQLSAEKEAPKSDQTAMQSCDEKVCKEWNSGYRASEGYGVYASASFLYWQLIEEDMEVANLTLVPTTSGGVEIEKIQVQKFNFKYKPGFKVDLGWNTGYDNWDLFAEYTWYHTGNMTTTVTAPGSLLFVGHTGPVLFSNIVGTDAFANSLNTANFASKTLNVKLDFADLMIAKSFCFGKKLLFRPAFGARGAWIRQRMVENQNSFPPLTFTTGRSGVNVTNATINSNNKTLSWGYGLKGSLEADWMLGSGFKMFGIGAADLVYTHYSLYNSIYVQSATSVPGVITTILTNSSEKKLYAVRPHAELELGFDWGMYFSDCQYYFNLAAAYGFQVFWSQNMFLEDTSTPLPKDDLFLQGLRVTALFAF